MFFLLNIKTRFAADAFQLLLPPALLVLVGRVHVLGANGAAVGLAQSVHQLAQAHGLLAKKSVAGVEHGFLVGIAEAIEGRVQLRNMVALGAFERIEVSPAGADIAVGGDQLLHRRAFASHFSVNTGQHHLGATLFGALGKSVDHRKMGDIFGVRAVQCRHMLQGVEIIAPVVWNATRVSQVVLVHLFDIGRIAAKEVGVGLVCLINGRSRARRRGVCFTHIPLTSVSLQETLAG